MNMVYQHLKINNTFILDEIIKIIEKDNNNFSEMVKLIEKFLYLNEKNISLEKVADLIIKSSSLFPLSFFGKYGTGKSTLFTLLYYYFIKKHSEGGLLYPILIDLNKFDLSNSENAQKQLCQFIDCVNDYIQIDADTHYLLMVDGINEYSDNHKELDTAVEGFINSIKENENYNGRFTFCIGKDEIIPDTIREESLLNSYMPKSEVKIEIRPLSKGDNLDGVFSQEFKDILATLNKLYSYGIPEENIEKVYKASWPYITNNIDYRTLHIILRVYCKHDTNTSFTAGLQDYYFKQLRNPSEYYLAAKHAYDVFIFKKINQRSLDFNRINSIILASKFSADFFVDVHFVKTLLDKSKIKPGSLGNDIVFTALTNRFIKDLIMAQPNTKQKSIVKKLSSAYEIEKSDTIKAQYAYLIGRMQDSNAQNTAKIFLLEKWEKLYSSLFFNCVLKLDKTVEEGTLVLFRTLSVSLTWLNENSKQEFFLKCIIYNERLNSINRGFRLSYYGDQSYINGADPVFVDNGLIPITCIM